MNTFRRRKIRLKTLTIGSQVRIVEGFYGGELGIVTEIISGTAESPDSLESSSDQVRITIDEATQITLPVNNIEVINVK